MTEQPTHLTPLDLDLAAAGELSTPARRRLDLHAAACSRCAEAMRARLGAETEFARSVLPRTLPRMLAARRRRTWTARLQGSLFLCGAAATAMVLLLWSPWNQGRGRSTSAGAPQAAPAVGDLIKGPPLLHLFARRGERVFPVMPGAALHSGDAVRFVVDPPGAGHLLIASVDGSGGISIYFPYRGEASGTVDPFRRFEVPDSITLDAAPGPERVFAFFSHAPLSAEQVRKALAPLARGGAAAIRDAREVNGLRAAQTSFLFEKAP